MSDQIKRDMPELEDFSRIDMRGWGDMTVTQGEVCQLIVTANTDVLDKLDISVKKNTLIIAFENNLSKEDWKALTKDPIQYEITLPTCESIRISGKGSLTARELSGEKLALITPGVGKFEIDSLVYDRIAIDSQGVTQTKIQAIKCSDLALSIKGTGKINILSLATDSLISNIKGSGSIQVAGKAKSQSINVPGVGNYNAENLATETAQLLSFGMTNSTLHVTKALKVKLRGMGNVRYYGNPKITKEIRGVGRIKHLGEKPKVTV